MVVSCRTVAKDSSILTQSWARNFIHIAPIYLPVKCGAGWNEETAHLAMPPHTHTYTRIHTHTHTHSTCTRTWVCSHMDICTHACTSAHIHAHQWSKILTYTIILEMAQSSYISLQGSSPSSGSTSSYSAWFAYMQALLWVGVTVLRDALCVCVCVLCFV